MLEKIEAKETASSRKNPFWMTNLEAEKIGVSNPCGIAQFTKTINESIPADMKPLSVAAVIKWLRNNGYLYEVNIDEKHKTNLPTDKGVQNSEGKDYNRVFYDVAAQRFMLSNIESIALFK